MYLHTSFIEKRTNFPVFSVEFWNPNQIMLETFFTHHVYYSLSSKMDIYHRRQNRRICAYSSCVGLVVNSRSSRFSLFRRVRLRSLLMIRLASRIDWRRCVGIGPSNSSSCSLKNLSDFSLGLFIIRILLFFKRCALFHANS